MIALWFIGGGCAVGLVFAVAGLIAAGADARRLTVRMERLSQAVEDVSISQHRCKAAIVRIRVSAAGLAPLIARASRALEQLDTALFEIRLLAARLAI